MNYSIISNSCVGYGIYKSLNSNISEFLIEYTNPLIASLFLDDEEYVKFCENYDYYISLKLEFKEPKITTNWYRDVNDNRYQNGDRLYAVSHLNDVEIHWIHDYHIDTILKKYQGRLELDKNITNKIFVWCQSEMFNIHTEEKRKELIYRFLNIKYKSIFLTNDFNLQYENDNHICYYVDEWKDKDIHKRDNYYLIPWNNQLFNIEIFKNIILQKKWI
jgi:uncharacterized protein (DUF1919 family)